MRCSLAFAEQIANSNSHQLWLDATTVRAWGKRMAANEYGFALYNSRMSALTPIYGWFIKGFYTLELKQIKVLDALAA